MQKIFGRHILYFGHKQQMEAHYLSAEEVAEFKNIVVKLGADIETAGDTTTCYTLLSPSSWIFKREKITIGEDSISYSNKKETTKVKFEEIQYAWIGSGPWYRVGKQVVFCGEQNICPKYNVHIDKLTDIIKNNIKVPLITGTECRSNIFWRIFHPFTKNPSIYLLSDGIAIFGSVGFKKLLYNEVDTYNINRKHFYSWNGDVYIKGVVNNIRKDQSGQSLIISQKGVGRCSWNKLKQAIKNNK